MTLTKGDLKNIASVFEQKFEEKGVATEDSLRNFATKNDLKPFATKNDLKLFATKDDIKLLATRKDVQKIDKKFDKLFKFLDRDFSKTKREVMEIQEHLNLPIATI